MLGSNYLGAPYPGQGYASPPPTTEVAPAIEVVGQCLRGSALWERDGATFSSTAGGLEVNPAWVMPERAQVLDGVCTTSSLGDFDSLTEFLVASNFGFQVPEEALVLGLVARVTRSATAGAKDASVLLRLGGVSSENRASTDTWPVTLEEQVYGGSSDSWGLAWTPEQINDAAFGLLVRGIKPGFFSPATVLSIDHVSVSVVYRMAFLDFVGEQRFTLDETGEWRQAIDVTGEVE